MQPSPPQNQFAKWKGNFKPCWTVLDIPKKNSTEFLFKLFDHFQEENAVFLCSGKTGRHSFFAKKPFLTFEYKNQKTYLNSALKTGKPLEILRALLQKFKAPKVKDLPPFYGGAIGFFGYEAFALFEDILKAKINDLNTPDIYLNFYDEVIIFDHLKSKLYLVGSAGEYDEAKRKVEEIQEKLQATSFKPQVQREIFYNNKQKNHFTSNFTLQEYSLAIEKVKKYLISGDTFQVNISQRLEAELTLSPAEIFQTLWKINPSPFSAYFNGGDFQIVSCSPERLIRKNGNTLFTQPIAGTRKRGKTAKEDLELEKELKNSAKEMAEHTMLVDLLRNDLGKVSVFGSVQTKQFAHIEKYSHVQHLVSNIYGKIKPECDFIDVFSAVFPGGTIAGAPKIRTMEIISELEPTQRGAYTGSLGYLGFNGDFDFNILIRTIVCTNKKMYIQVGGGIVMDSVAEKEYQETLHKAEAMLRAVRVR